MNEATRDPVRRVRDRVPRAARRRTSSTYLERAGDDADDARRLIDRFLAGRAGARADRGGDRARAGAARAGAAAPRPASAAGADARHGRGRARARARARSREARKVGGYYHELEVGHARPGAGRRARLGRARRHAEGERPRLADCGPTPGSPRRRRIQRLPTSARTSELSTSELSHRLTPDAPRRRTRSTGSLQAAPDRRGWRACGVTIRGSARACRPRALPRPLRREELPVPVEAIAEDLLGLRIEESWEHRLLGDAPARRAPHRPERGRARRRPQRPAAPPLPLHDRARDRPLGLPLPRGPRADAGAVVLPRRWT